MKLLVIEGATEATDAVAAELERAGIDVVRGLTRESATTLIHKHDAHVIVMVAVPFQGWQLQLLRDLRSWQPPPYSLAITDPEPSDTVALLEAGADVCCAFPLASGVCAAQIGALARRAEEELAAAPVPDVVSVRELSIDFTRFQVALAGAPLAITPAEFRILATLARRAGKVVPTNALFREALGYDASSQQSKDILKVHIRRIRNKIRDAGGADDYVCNVRGFGYLLERRSRAAQAYEPDDDDAEEIAETADTI